MVAFKYKGWYTFGFLVAQEMKCQQFYFIVDLYKHDKCVSQNVMLTVLLMSGHCWQMSKQISSCALTSVEALILLLHTLLLISKAQTQPFLSTSM